MEGQGPPLQLPIPPRPPPTDERRKRGAYLRRPDVAEVMDDLVSQCLMNMPEDPATFILHHLERRTGVSRMQDSDRSDNGAPIGNCSNRTPPPPPPPELTPNILAPVGARHTAAEELLRWLIASVKDHNSPPAAASDVARQHPLFREVAAIAQRMLLEREASFTSEEVSMAMLPDDQKPALVRSVTKVTQAIVAAGRDTVRALTALAASLRDLLGADQCSVFIADEVRRTLTCNVKGKDIVIPYGKGIAGLVATSGEAIRTSKAYEDVRFNPNVDLLVSYVTTALLTTPMKVDGKLLAVVQLVNKRDGTAFTEDDEALFESFTKIAGVAVRNSMFYQEAQRVAEQNAIIAQINADLANSDLDESRLIPTVVRGAKDIVGADRCAFFKVVDGGQTLIAHLEGVFARIKLSTASGIVGWVARNGKPLNVPEAYKDARFNREVDQASGYKTRSLLCFPIFASNELVAIVQLVNKKHRTTGEAVPFDAEDERVLKTFGEVAGVCIRNCQLHADLVRQQAMLEDVAQVATFLSSTDSDITKPASILTFIAEKVAKSAKADRCVFYRVSDTQSAGEVVFEAAYPQLIFGDSSTALAGDDSDDGSQVPGIHVEHAKSVTPQGTHYSGTGVIGVHAVKPRSTYVTKPAHLATLEEELRVTNGQPNAILIIPIVDTGVSVGCCVLVNPDTDLAHSVVKAGSIRRRDSRANMQLLLQGSGHGRRPSEVAESLAADIAVCISMAGFTLRVARMLDVAMQHGNNLTALMDLDHGTSALGHGPNADSVDSNVLSPERSASGVWFRCDEAEASALSNPSFDVHRYRRGELPPQQLVAMIKRMFTNLDLLEPLGIKEQRLHRFIMAIRSKYRDVPYHNFFHAFDVTQTCYAYVLMAKLETIFTKEELFALMIACVCHDVDHMGLNNSFHMRAETPLAILTSVSGQKSVLEVHHCQVAVDLMSKTHLLAEVNKDSRAKIQRLMINCILATDMALHKERLQEYDTELAQRFEPGSDHHRHLLMTMLLKMGDISNVTKDFDISRQWGIAVTEEFYQQGDAERDAGLEVTPMFDRERKLELAKGQIGFIKMVGAPFFSLAAKVLPEFAQLVKVAESNIGQWERVLQVTSSTSC
jgi:GAF domain-containing protein